MSTSRDAALARQLLQDDMQAMMSADEELARQLQEELNGVPSPPNVLFNPLRPLGFRESREDSPETSSPEAHSPPPFPMPMPRGRHYPGRPMFARGEEMRRRRGRPGGANLPQGEFDPDERLLAGGHPEDFLSIMHDPSLMLLMLLLRAPDTLNEGGVDLEDYEGLWELAERLGEVRRRGITEEEINQLPTHKFKSESAKVEFGAAAAEANAVQCQICLVDFEVGDSLRSIPCKHDFHKGCIDEWLK
nr:hypothetical protein BaRGS_002401 [Batillaria attramentaria]